jgi:hypothetical protein
VRTSADALLSVRRWVSNVLPGPPWRVMLAGDEGLVQRPYAVVSTADGVSTSHDVPNTMRNVLPIVVHAFPPAGSRASGSKLIAERVAAALSVAVQAGVPDRRVVGLRSRSQLIPLFDYGGINAENLTSEGALSMSNPGRLRPDYLRVLDGFKAQSLPQADDGQMFVASLELRVQWFSPTGLRSTGTTLADANVRIN